MLLHRSQLEKPLERRQSDLASPDAGPQIIRAYLSRQHLEDVENSCPMVALPCDVARGDARVKAAFENVFKAMVDVLSREVKRSAQPSETAALAIASLCIGGMLVARSLNDPRFADCLREAATSAALAMGGWKQPKSRKRSTAAR